MQLQHEPKILGGTLVAPFPRSRASLRPAFRASAFPQLTTLLPHTQEDPHGNSSR